MTKTYQEVSYEYGINKFAEFISSIVGYEVEPGMDAWEYLTGERTVEGLEDADAYDGEEPEGVEEGLYVGAKFGNMAFYCFYSEEAGHPWVIVEGA